MGQQTKSPKEMRAEIADFIREAANIEDDAGADETAAVLRGLAREVSRWRLTLSTPTTGEKR